MAGGLTNLSKMPACNIMLLGAQRKTLSGFSSTSVLPHTGYIYHSDIVQSLPPVSRPDTWSPWNLLLWQKQPCPGGSVSLSNLPLCSPVPTGHS